MEEQQQVTTKEPQQEPQRVTTKDPKKVEAGKRLAAHNRKKRELKVHQSEAASGAQSGVSQYYGIGAVLAVGAIGGLGYYIYQSKKGEVSIVPHHQPAKQPSPHPQAKKFEID